MKGLALIEWIIGIVIVVVLSATIWAIWSEATFDYTRCIATDQYKNKHTAAWQQWQPQICSSSGICTGGYTIYHPEQNWTERLYSCPDKKMNYFDKWRRENRS